MVQVLKQLACWLVGTEYKAGMDVHQIDDVPKKRLQSMLRAQACLLNYGPTYYGPTCDGPTYHGPAYYGPTDYGPTHCGPTHCSARSSPSSTWSSSSSTAGAHSSARKPHA